MENVREIKLALIEKCATIVATGENMRTVESIYNIKTYPCIITYSEYESRYKIYDCEWGTVKHGSGSLEVIFPSIQAFYSKLDMKIPQASDFIPKKVCFDNYIYVILSGNNLYNVCATRSYSDSTEYDLIENISYDLAIEKAEQIVKICENAK